MQRDTDFAQHTLDHHTMNEDERVRLQIDHAKEITRFNWSRFFAGFACGLGIALALFTLVGCGTTASQDGAYYGRDRYSPSPERIVFRSPYGEGFNPHDDR